VGKAVALLLRSIWRSQLANPTLPGISAELLAKLCVFAERRG
jgi:hypothetical protein